MGGSLCRPGLVLLLSGLVACGSNTEGTIAGDRSGENAMAQIEGSVFYRERMMLPPGAEVQVLVQRVAEPVQRTGPAQEGDF